VSSHAFMVHCTLALTSVWKPERNVTRCAFRIYAMSMTWRSIVAVRDGFCLAFKLPSSACYCPYFFSRMTNHPFCWWVLPRAASMLFTSPRGALEVTSGSNLRGYFIRLDFQQCSFWEPGSYTHMYGYNTITATTAAGDLFRPAQRTNSSRAVIYVIYVLCYPWWRMNYLFSEV
jgi:hypothetical protein